MIRGREYEEILLNQWQPLQTMLYDGWILRFAEGYTKRANSVNPIYFSKEDVNVKIIKQRESIYASHQLKTTFKITPFVQPTNSQMNNVPTATHLPLILDRIENPHELLQILEQTTHVYESSMMQPWEMSNLDPKLLNHLSDGIVGFKIAVKYVENRCPEADELPLGQWIELLYFHESTFMKIYKSQTTLVLKAKCLAPYLPFALRQSLDRF